MVRFCYTVFGGPLQNDYYPGSIHTLASRARQHPARFFDAFKRAFNMCVCYTVIGGQLLIFASICYQSRVRLASGASLIRRAFYLQSFDPFPVSPHPHCNTRSEQHDGNHCFPSNSSGFSCTLPCTEYPSKLGNCSNGYIFPLQLTT